MDRKFAAVLGLHVCGLSAAKEMMFTLIMAAAHTNSSCFPCDASPLGIRILCDEPSNLPSKHFTFDQVIQT